MVSRARIVAGVTAAIEGLAPLASPVFTGDPKAPTPSGSDNDTSIATTALVKSALAALSTLKPDVEDQTITGGARVTVKDLGSASSGTITPDPGDRPIQRLANNGAFTLAPGTNYGAYQLIIQNGATAGAITTSGWSKVVGDSFDTVNGHNFFCQCIVTAYGSVLSIVAM